MKERLSTSADVLFIHLATIISICNVCCSSYVQAQPSKEGPSERKIIDIS